MSAWTCFEQAAIDEPSVFISIPNWCICHRGPVSFEFIWLYFGSSIQFVSVCSSKWIECRQLVPSSTNLILLASWISSPSILSTDICSSKRHSKHVEVHDCSNWLPKWCEISLKLSNPMLSVLATACEGASAHDKRSGVIKSSLVEGRSEDIVGSLRLHMSHEWMGVILFKPGFRVCSIQSNSGVIQAELLWGERDIVSWFISHVRARPGGIPWSINSLVFQALI